MELEKRNLVLGHWRIKINSENSSLRKYIWIPPYWKRLDFNGYDNPSVNNFNKEV